VARGFDPIAQMGRYGEHGELLGESFHRRFQELGKREQIEREIGLALGGCFGICGAIRGFERRCGFGETEVRAKPETEFVARKNLGAGPVKNAGDFRTCAKLEHRGREILRGAGLAKFVGVEDGRFARGPVGEEALVETAFAARAVAHQERSTESDREGGCDGVDETLAFNFLLRVNVDGRDRIGDGVRRAVAGENLFGREMEQARIQLLRETREERGEGDVELMGTRRIFLALGGLGDCGGVDDRVGFGALDRGGDGGFIGEIEGDFFGDAGWCAGEASAKAPPTRPEEPRTKNFIEEKGRERVNCRAC
jgi:hypothetical protein